MIKLKLWSWSDSTIFQFHHSSTKLALLPEYMTSWLGISRESVSAPLQGSEALQYSAGDVEIHGFVQVFNQIITILSTPTCLN